MLTFEKSLQTVMWLSNELNGCMLLMCTAIHSSQCLLCFTVIALLISLFCGSYTLFSVTPIGSSWFHSYITVKSAFMVAASYYHYLNFLGYDGKLIFDSYHFAFVYKGGIFWFTLLCRVKTFMTMLCTADFLIVEQFM
ncbi:hypothetical protein JRO89_XS02G0082000 [Xanthoceras sorbifolium]|uniref:NADH dehydrogenase subunit 6 n=1 Tax=Xanthoceras sorbifolium TaxID=99658 RepID=A0ABQ8IFT9_9ROSI|nr:hypothetical protein JRO89_XS02G0082000 [Xanthoceras sorbifolium]